MRWKSKKAIRTRVPYVPCNTAVRVAWVNRITRRSWCFLLSSFKAVKTKNLRAVGSMFSKVLSTMTRKIILYFCGETGIPPEGCASELQRLIMMCDDLHIPLVGEIIPLDIIVDQFGYRFDHMKGRTYDTAFYFKYSIAYARTRMLSPTNRMCPLEFAGMIGLWIQFLEL